MLTIRILFAWLHRTSAVKQRKKLVIDNDAGGDDAMGIFIALLQEKYFNGPQLVALTTVNGNAAESCVINNNQKILKVARRQDVPIYRGATRSLVFTPKSSGYYGTDGLGDNNESHDGLVEAQKMGAAQALIELSKQYEGELTVVTLGPLSNIAMAINLDPKFIERLDQLYIAASHIHNDLFTNPEFNANSDAEAFHVVANVSSKEKVTIFPFSQTKLHLNISKDWRTNVLGAIDSDIIRAQNSYERISLNRSDRWQSLDPAAVALAINPSLVEEYRNYSVCINLCGESRGISQFVPDAINSNMRVIYEAKMEEYKKFLIDTFSVSSKETK